MPIPDLHRQQILLFVHKFIHRKNCLPNVFADYFVLNRNVHSHIARGINDLHVTVVNENYGKKSLKHKATDLWNGLPNTLKKVSSIKKFTQKVKSFLRSANTYC